MISVLNLRKREKSEVFSMKLFIIVMSIVNIVLAVANKNYIGTLGWISSLLGWYLYYTEKTTK